MRVAPIGSPFFAIPSIVVSLNDVTMREIAACGKCYRLF
jgi:hypothetical protein